MKSEMKFEEAEYRDETIKHKFSLEEITEMYKTNRKYFENKIRGHLYCLECHTAKLKFNPGHSRQRCYFSTVDQHQDDCSGQCDPAPNRTLVSIDKAPDLYNLQTRLENCLYRFLKGRETRNNPCILYPGDDPSSPQKSPGQSSTANPYRYIPRKRIIRDMHRTIPDVFKAFKIYYEQVELEWYENNSENRAVDWYPHKLRIFRDGEKQPVCILRFSDNVYKHLPNNIQEYAEDGRRFSALVAFYAKLDGNSRPIGPKDEAPCGATINDSRKIKFLDDAVV